MGCCSSQATKGVANAYYPSSMALSLGVPKKTDYQLGYNSRSASTPTYRGNKKVLVIGTEERFLKMANGKLFDTGNHPVETLLPMMYLHDAGFKFDFGTPTGKPIHFEMWAFPEKDENVKKFYDQMKPAMDSPKSLSNIKTTDMASAYAAVFIPGGHGAMHLVDNAVVGRILRTAHSQQITTISLCHGPGTLLSTALGGEFCYKGYEICVFPDKVDDFTPKIGYMPGKMVAPVSATLEAKGCVLKNKDADDKTHIDRELITGASPKASNNLGKVAADYLLKKFGNENPR